MNEENLAHALEANLPPGMFALLGALGSLADERGTGAYVVGGVVRDLLLGDPSFDLDVVDLDVVVEEPADEFAAHAAERHGGEVKAHTRFGTAILVLADGRKIDLATARSEAYERPGALPVVRPGPIREDLRRRDFTVNSMAVQLNADAFGQLLDYFDGREDLRAGVLRVLTEQSFEDDPTRILRGVRFAARFGFRFTHETERLLRRAVGEDRMASVSGERIMNELVLMLREEAPWPQVVRLEEWGILKTVTPGWSVPVGAAATFGTIALGVPPRTDGNPADEIEERRRIWPVYFLAMLEPNPPELRAAVLDRLNAGRHVRLLVRDLARFEERSVGTLTSEADLPNSEIFLHLDGIAPEVVTFAAARWRNRRLWERVALYRSELAGTRPALSGSDIEALGVPRGPAVGRILSALLDARLDGRVTTRDEERKIAIEMCRELDAPERS